MIPNTNHLEATLNATTESVFLLDNQGFVLEVNETGAKRLNKSRSELSGTYVFDFFPPDSAAVRVSAFQDVVRSGLVKHTEDSRDGRIFSLTYYPVTDQNGHVDAVAVYAAEITARKRAEQSLLESEELKSSVLKHAAYAIIATDPGGTITVFNQSAQTLLGYCAEEVIGHQTPALFHLPCEMAERAHALSLELGTEIEPGFDAFITKTRLTGGPDEHEFTYVRKDGSHVAVLLSVTARTNSQGVVVGYLGVAQDITARKQSESDLRIAAIAFQSQEGMLVTDETGKILRVNRAFTRITGYSESETVGQTPSLLKSGRHDAAFYGLMWESLVRHGSWQGEILNQRKSGEVYPERLSINAVKDEGGRVTHYLAIFTDVTERKAAEGKIESLAFFDPLTGLPNRRLLMDRLEQALTSSAHHGQHGALLLLDLDNFKTLNDTQGHLVGDQLLVEVAERLKLCIREGDTVARLGGDEFVVLLESLDRAGMAALQAESVAQKILKQFSHPYPLQLEMLESIPDKRSHHCTSSIGIAMFSDDTVSLHELLKRADTAMYQAKAAGRNTYRFFDQEMRAMVTRRAALEADLREAVSKDQFSLYYQAQMDGKGHVSGAEVLLRWQHPERGLVLPSEFISLAEDTGLILKLGQWVLETACVQLAAWARQPDRAHLTVAVNVSVRQFHHETFVDQVLYALDRTGANPNRLKLELTESLLVKDVEDIIAKMNTLKAKGVGFALDDFGTGYSSLAYLKRLPLDQLKIDQGFVRNILTDPNDAAIAKMVIALAESMGLAVMAEGVETQAQCDFLARMGCHAYQGYLFSFPLPLSEFEAWMMSVCSPCFLDP
ncbi:MAG: EAL domain-containing protein [Pseudomonadota bacterium]